MIHLMQNQTVMSCDRTAQGCPVCAAVSIALLKITEGSGGGVMALHHQWITGVNGGQGIGQIGTILLQLFIDCLLNMGMTAARSQRGSSVSWLQMSADEPIMSAFGGRTAADWGDLGGVGGDDGAIGGNHLGGDRIPTVIVLHQLQGIATPAGLFGAIAQGDS